MSIDWGAAVLAGLTITGAATLTCGVFKAARGVIAAWQDATRLLAGETAKHPAPADGNQPGPGPDPVPGQPFPRKVPQQEGADCPVRHAPAPDITPHEAAFLAALGRLREIAQPGQVMAGREIADGLRVRIPGVDDWTLGVITLDLVGYLKALYFGLPDGGQAMQCAMDAFGLAAEELTRLDRNGVPR